MKRIVLSTIIISISLSFISCSNSSNPNIQNELAQKITIEQAKKIALKHENLTSSEVSFVKAESDIDNKVEKYDIEFYYDNKEYDYEINAANGEIIKYDYDVENYTIPNQKQTNARSITEDEAKEIALKHANLTSDQVNFISVKLDTDDGVNKYDVEFHYNNKEYDYEINANDGSIISYERD